MADEENTAEGEEIIVEGSVTINLHAANIKEAKAKARAESHNELRLSLGGLRGLLLLIRKEPLNRCYQSEVDKMEAAIDSISKLMLWKEWPLEPLRFPCAGDATWKNIGTAADNNIYPSNVRFLHGYQDPQTNEFAPQIARPKNGRVKYVKGERLFVFALTIVDDKGLVGLPVEKHCIRFAVSVFHCCARNGDRFDAKGCRKTALMRLAVAPLKITLEDGVSRDPDVIDSMWTEMHKPANLVRDNGFYDNNSNGFRVCNREVLRKFRLSYC